MNYKYKYLKYKNKYMLLKRKMNLNKYAIFMICFFKDHYVLGACIAAFTHKQYLKKLNLNIELVIMCDDYIYNKYNQTLNKYFDKVTNIKLRSFDLSEDYKFAKDKYTWINVSLSKWECLKYDEYDKILFIDIDILPNNTSFYDILNFNTPAFLNNNLEKECISSKAFKYKLNNSYYKYINENLNNIGSIDGGILLLKPSKETHKEYVNFTNYIYKNGIYSHSKSSPDESSLFYFYLKKNINMYDICREYAVIPWDNHKFVKEAKAYNFLSWIKPWVKPLFLSWSEETIWRDIYNIMPHYEKIEKILNNSIIEYINEYNKMSHNRKMKSNNLDYVTKYNNEFNTIINSPNNLENIKILENKIHFNKYGILNKNKITKIDDIIS